MVTHVGTERTAALGVHTHTSVYEAKVCQGLVRPLYVPPVAPPVSVIEPSSRAQQKYVRDLGGDEHRARQMSRAECSKYIDELIRDKRTPVSEPSEPVVYIDPNILSLIEDGRYAWRPDESMPLLFLRVSRPKTGQHAGTIKVQTKHSETYHLAFLVNRSGRQYKYPAVGYAADFDLFEALKGIWIDKDEARMQYSRNYHECCICGKDLTDERSRWYGIGPDCETRNLRHIEYVHNTRGVYVASA